MILRAAAIRRQWGGRTFVSPRATGGLAIFRHASPRKNKLGPSYPPSRDIAEGAEQGGRLNGLGNEVGHQRRADAVEEPADLLLDLLLGQDVIGLAAMVERQEVEQLRVDLFGRVLVGDRPTRSATRGAQLGVEREFVDLDHDAVDLVLDGLTRTPPAVRAVTLDVGGGLVGG